MVVQSYWCFSDPFSISTFLILLFFPSRLFIYGFRRFKFCLQSTLKVLGFRLKTSFANASADSKKYAPFNSDQKWLKNNNLSSLYSKSMTHSVAVRLDMIRVVIKYRVMPVLPFEGKKTHFEWKGWRLDVTFLCVTFAKNPLYRWGFYRKELNPLLTSKRLIAFFEYQISFV